MKANSYSAHIKESTFVAHSALVLGMPNNTPHARRVLRAFFQTLRERIQLVASSALVAHLPAEIQQMYTNGWDDKSLKLFDYDEFIDVLFQSKGAAHTSIFISKNEVEAAVSIIFEVIKGYSTEPQYNAMMSFMPLLLRVNLSSSYLLKGKAIFHKI